MLCPYILFKLPTKVFGYFICATALIGFSNADASYKLSPYHFDHFHHTPAKYRDYWNINNIPIMFKCLLSGRGIQEGCPYTYRISFPTASPLVDGPLQPPNDLVIKPIIQPLNHKDRLVNGLREKGLLFSCNSLEYGKPQSHSPRRLVEENSDSNPSKCFVCMGKACNSHAVEPPVPPESTADQERDPNIEVVISTVENVSRDSDASWPNSIEVGEPEGSTSSLSGDFDYHVIDLSNLQDNLSYADALSLQNEAVSIDTFSPLNEMDLITMVAVSGMNILQLSVDDDSLQWHVSHTNTHAGTSSGHGIIEDFLSISNQNMQFATGNMAQLQDFITHLNQQSSAAQSNNVPSVFILNHNGHWTTFYFHLDSNGSWTYQYADSMSAEQLVTVPTEVADLLVGMVQKPFRSNQQASDVNTGNNCLIYALLNARDMLLHRAEESKFQANDVLSVRLDLIRRVHAQLKGNKNILMGFFDQNEIKDLLFEGGLSKKDSYEQAGKAIKQYTKKLFDDFEKGTQLDRAEIEQALMLLQTPEFLLKGLSRPDGQHYFCSIIAAADICRFLLNTWSNTAKTDGFDDIAAGMISAGSAVTGGTSADTEVILSNILTVAIPVFYGVNIFNCQRHPVSQKLCNSQNTDIMLFQLMISGFYWRIANLVYLASSQQENLFTREISQEQLMYAAIATAVGQTLITASRMNELVEECQKGKNCNAKIVRWLTFVSATQLTLAVLSGVSTVCHIPSTANTKFCSKTVDAVRTSVGAAVGLASLFGAYQLGKVQNIERYLQFYQKLTRYISQLSASSNPPSSSSSDPNDLRRRLASVSPSSNLSNTLNVAADILTSGKHVAVIKLKKTYSTQRLINPMHTEYYLVKKGAVNGPKWGVWADHNSFEPTVLTIPMVNTQRVKYDVNVKVRKHYLRKDGSPDGYTTSMNSGVYFGVGAVDGVQKHIKYGTKLEILFDKWDNPNLPSGAYHSIEPLVITGHNWYDNTTSIKDFVIDLRVENTNALVKSSARLIKISETTSYFSEKVVNTQHTEYYLVRSGAINGPQKGVWADRGSYQPTTLTIPMKDSQGVQHNVNVNVKKHYLNVKGSPDGYITSMNSGVYFSVGEVDGIQKHIKYGSNLEFLIDSKDNSKLPSGDYNSIKPLIITSHNWHDDAEIEEFVFDLKIENQ